MDRRKNKKSPSLDGDLLTLTDILQKERGGEKKRDNNLKKVLLGKNDTDSPPSLNDLLEKDLDQWEERKTIDNGTTNRDPLSSLPDIKTLLPSQPLRKVGKPTKKIRSNKNQKSLQESIVTAKVERKSEEKLAGSNSTGLRIGKHLIIVLVALLTVTITTFFLSNKKKPAVPESLVARQLMSIVDGLEKYRSENNRLPDKLSDLLVFPRNAVEWPIEKYYVQLETPLLELFFAVDSEGYIVVARHENEAWTYTENATIALRKVPAR